MRWTDEQLAKYQQKQTSVRRPSCGTGCSVVDMSLRGARPQSSIPVALEHEEQVAFVHWLRLMGFRHNATPNGGHRDNKTAKTMKSEGLAAGFPDITVWPEIGSGLPILFVEMKRTRGGRVSADQSDWLEYLSGLSGYRIEATVCLGAAEAIDFVKEKWALRAA